MPLHCRLPCPASLALALSALAFGCTAEAGEVSDLLPDVEGAESASTKPAPLSDEASDRIVREGKVTRDARTPTAEYSAQSKLDGYIPRVTLAQATAMLERTDRWTEIVGFRGEKFFSGVNLERTGAGHEGAVDVQEPFAMSIPIRFTVKSTQAASDAVIVNTSGVSKYLVTIVDPGNFSIVAHLRPYKGGVIAHFETTIKVNYQEEQAAAYTGEFVFDWMKRSLAYR